MVLSCPSKKIINDTIKLHENNNQNNKTLEKNERNKIKTNCNKNISSKDNNARAILNQSFVLSDFNNNNNNCNNNMNMNININNNNYNNNNNTVIKEKNSNSNSKLKNEKITSNLKNMPLSNPIESQNKLKSLNENQINQNISENKKIAKKITNIGLRKEKEAKSFYTSSDINSNNNNKKLNNEIPKRPDIRSSNGTELVRPVIKKRPPFIPTISDSKNNEKNKAESENSKHINKGKQTSTLENENQNSKTETEPSMNPLKSTLSSSQAALIANASFKSRKEIINKRIVKAITRYKPTIEVPTTPDNLIESTFNIYKIAHLEFCRKCLIPKDVLYFQGLLLFKNINKLKEMKLSRQQINNALEWEVIKYTVFNSKSTDNWTSLLNQYKNDRTSTKILSRRYASRKHNQKCIKKETENFERKFIAYNIIKRKAPIVMNYYNSVNEEKKIDPNNKPTTSKNLNINDSNIISINNNNGNSNNSNNNNNNNNNNKLFNTNKSIQVKINDEKPSTSTYIPIINKSDGDKTLYNDVGSFDDYKRIFSKVIEQRVKVVAKKNISKSSPLKESMTIDYTVKRIKNKNKSSGKSHVLFNLNDINDFASLIYPKKLIKNSNFCSVNDTEETEIINSILNYNAMLLQTLKNNQNKINFNNLISCYLYYLLNIFYIALPSIKPRKINSKGLKLNKSKNIYTNLTILLNHSNKNGNNSNYQYANFINTINNLAMQKFINFNKIKNNKSMTNKNPLLPISEQSKLFIINYLLYYIFSPNNRLSSLTFQTKKARIVCLLFTPLISNATNKLNISYLKRNPLFKRYKRQRIRYEKMQSILSNKNIKNKHLTDYIWNSNIKQKSNLIINYLNTNSKNYFTKKTFVNTIYPIINKAFNIIQMPNQNNKSNKNFSLNDLKSKNKMKEKENYFNINNKKLHDSNDNLNTNTNDSFHGKLDFVLPELNTNKTLYNYKKIVMDSYITFSSLRHRKNCSPSTLNSCNEIHSNPKDFFFHKSNSSSKEKGNT